MGAAKATYAITEKEEVNKHILEKDRKEAEQWLKPATEAYEGSLKAHKAIEAEATPMTSLPSQNPEDILKFAKAATLSVKVEALATEAAKKLVEAKTLIKEKMGEVTKVTPQTSATATAKKDLSAMLAKLDKDATPGKQAANTVKAGVSRIVTATKAAARKALRAEMV